MVTRNPFLAGAPRVRRLWLVVGWVLVLLVVYLSLTPSPIEVPIEQGDKFSHALAYLVLMSWFANFYETPIQRAGLALGFILLGVGLEFVQRWTGYRSFDVIDMVAGTAGVVLGWVLAPPRTLNFLELVEKFFEK